MVAPEYRGASLIRNSTPPEDHHKALGIVPLQGPAQALVFMSEEPPTVADDEEEEGEGKVSDDTW